MAICVGLFREHQKLAMPDVYVFCRVLLAASQSWQSLISTGESNRMGIGNGEAEWQYACMQELANTA